MGQTIERAGGRRQHATSPTDVWALLAGCGIAIFDAEVDKVRRIMDGDPGMQAGVFTYEVHPCRSFPGDALAG
ncbi:MAG TPA: hypothetical protein VG276_07050 [Actinomycetes bacterium]|nr:hypothetical protein [Actinomycetes bacterium]